MTIKDCLNRAAAENPDAVSLRFKRNGAWQTRTFKALLERVWHVAEMLDRLGVKEGDRVALYLENSPEWFEIYHGIVGIGAVAVPVDAKLRDQEVEHILHDCGVSIVFCSVRFTFIEYQRIGVRAIVALDGESGDPPKAKGIVFHNYEELWEEVSAVAMSGDCAFNRRAPEDRFPASLIYTSGTTGRPKGAVLTHRNFVSNVESVAKAIDIHKTDNFMLILPLHHSFAFTTMLVLPVYAQCQVSLVENLKTIKANMQDVSPTVLLAVPLLLEKMLARIMAGIKSNKAANLMFRCGLAHVVGRKIKKGLGGSLRVIVSGGAPISPATLSAWNKLGFNITEGYGITETAPVLTFNPPEASRVGTVGVPISGVEIKISEPDSTGVGEIIARGENVMQGYYNNPEETSKVLRNGWYYTGDLGYFDEAGYLVISGRKKSLIVNREGKNIYPEELELQAMKSDFVLECLAIGYREPHEDTGERVGMIVVPNLAVFETMDDRSDQRLSDKEIETLVCDDVRKQLSPLSSYKQPRRIQVNFEEFEKTTTQKIKRYLYAINTAELG